MKNLDVIEFAREATSKWDSSRPLEMPMVGTGPETLLCQPDMKVKFVKAAAKID